MMPRFFALWKKRDEKPSRQKAQPVKHAPSIRHEVYFDLKFLDAPDKTDTGLPKLKAGQTYRVRARADLNNDPNGEQFKVIIHSDVTLHLSPKDNEAVAIQGDSPPIAAGDILTFQQEFQVRIEDECPVGELQLDLGYKRADDQHTDDQPMTATKLHAYLEGTYDPKLMKACNISLDTQLPPNTALLHVQSPETDKMQEGERPLVFVNACHSARLMYDENRKPYGLPEISLARFAGGYIGTLGPVGSKYAVELAEQMLCKDCATSDGIEPAEALRQLREQVVKALAETENGEPTEDDWLRFIYTFMYVYYGNPFARLRLTANQEEGHNHE